ncbi:hypothetical protein [Haliangium sp.]|uniref:hypothetical protein n=1 Tax=Haliangium sp. TaxID=2663208 RepID=UPI003D12E7C1
MAFRDDRDAAYARAEALTRELAEKERELAEKDQALQAAERELAEAEKEREAAAAAKQKLTANEDEARARLDEVVGRSKKRKRAAARAKATAETRKRLHLERQLGDRVDKSLSLLAHTELHTVGVLLMLPTIYATMFATIRFGPPFLAIVPGTVVGLSLLVRQLTPWWCRRLYERERAWAAARDIDGYPELLVRKPRGRDESRHGMSHDGHDQMTVTLQFEAEPPPDLDQIMRGAKLEPAGPRRFRRRSPVTRQRSRSGPLLTTEDHNRAIYKAVRALDRDVFAPLRVAYGLTKVAIKLD